MRGQCYDGASNMSGAKKGVAAVIAEHTTNAPLHTLQLSHLKLVHSASCKILVSNMYWQPMTDAAIFINYSPKRERLLEDACH